MGGRCGFLLVSYGFQCHGRHGLTPGLLHLGPRLKGHLVVGVVVIAIESGCTGVALLVWLLHVHVGEAVVAVLRVLVLRNGGVII